MTGISTPYLGSGSTSPGQNSIYSNSPYDVKNATTLTVMAENNWWNNILGPTAIYGSVDYSPWLMLPPGGGPMPPRPPEKENDGMEVIADAIDNALFTADSLFAEGEFEDALALYARIVSRNGDDERAAAAASQVRSCLIELGREDDWREWLLDAANNQGLANRVRIGLKRYLAHSDLKAGNRDAARGRMAEALQDADGDERTHPFMLFDLAMLQHYGLGDPRAAAGTLEEFIQSYAEHPLAAVALREIVECERDFPDVDGNADEKSPVEIPTGFGITGVHPNPFNSTTTISYSVISSGNVRLAIYDLAGHEVARLVDGITGLRAGNHIATWDASGISSGIYLARLEMEGKAFTQKLTLVK